MRLVLRSQEHDSPYYSDVIIADVSIVYSTVCSGADQRNIKATRHWPLWVEFSGDRWIPRTKDQ